MGAAFWVKRGLIVLVISFAAIFAARYFKSHDIAYAFMQAALWGAFSCGVYLLVLWNTLRKNPSCAIKQQKEK